jgi:hypothetical protein
LFYDYHLHGGAARHVATIAREAGAIRITIDLPHLCMRTAAYIVLPSLVSSSPSRQRGPDPPGPPPPAVDTCLDSDKANRATTKAKLLVSEFPLLFPTATGAHPLPIRPASPSRLLFLAPRPSPLDPLPGRLAAVCKYTNRHCTIYPMSLENLDWLPIIVVAVAWRSTDHRWE